MSQWTLAQVGQRAKETAWYTLGALLEDIPDESAGGDVARASERLLEAWRTQAAQSVAEDAYNLLGAKIGSKVARFMHVGEVFWKTFQGKNDELIRLELAKCNKLLAEKQEKLTRLGATLEAQMGVLKQIGPQVTAQRETAVAIASVAETAGQEARAIADLSDAAFTEQVALFQTEVGRMLQDPAIQRHVEDLTAIKASALLLEEKRTKIREGMATLTRLLALENTQIEQMTQRLDKITTRNEALNRDILALQERAKQLSQKAGDLHGISQAIAV